MSSERGTFPEQATRSLRVGDRDLDVWPASQTIAPMVARMGLATFADCASFHTPLIEAVLAAEQDPMFRDPSVPRGCAAKVRSPAQWGVTAADLIEARAATLAQTVLGRPVHVDNAWASVYRAGDYCIPHSHRRATVSLIYMLDPGEPVNDGDLSGKLYFADARIAECCPHERGRVTRMVAPEMPAGAMLVFAGEYVHGVNPYIGNRPRITLSWNMTLERLEGDPLAWT